MQNRKHNSRSSILDPRSSILHPRSAFSFAEVMFAVVILGIGFIMVAAVFPVAIQQTQTTGEENIAAALAREAANSISQLPTTIKNPCYDPTVPTPAAPAVIPPATVQTELLFPPTVKPYYKPAATVNAFAAAAPAIVVPFTGNRWDIVKSNVMLPSDPRYGYAVFYRRENNSSAAQLIVVATTIRNRPVYDSTKDLTSFFSGSMTVTTQEGDLKQVALSASPLSPTQTVICPDLITLGNSTANPLEGWCIEMPPPAVGALASPAGRSYNLACPNPQGHATNSPPMFELGAGDSMELTAGSGGLWGTTAASGGVKPNLPVVDTAVAGATAYLYPSSTLQPVVAYATLQTTPTSPAGQITLSLTSDMTNPTMPTPPTGPAVQGAYVIVADDYPLAPTVVKGAATGLPDYVLPDNQPNATPPYMVGALNGHIFRLGAPVAKDASGNAVPPGTFNLDPAYGMAPPLPGSNYSADTVPNPSILAASHIGPVCAKVYIIGASRTDPTVTGSSATYTGAAQDIGIFTTYFQVQ